MTTMPKGQPRSVPDPEGELYDANMADLRRRREEAEAGRTKIARPSLAQSFIPVVGPAWEAVADYQDGNYAGAAFNGAMAVADVLPIGIAAKGLRAASKGIGVVRKGSVTAKAAANEIRAKGLAGKGQEIHHTVPLRA